MQLKLALLSRYPPIEGGISAKTYWLARGLTLRGHEVHVITHPGSAGGEYRLEGDPNLQADDLVKVHRPSEIPWHLPEDQEQSLGLLDTASRVGEEYGITIIDSDYLVPYGIVGHLAKMSTGAKNILRHGGSDIEKFLKRGILDRLLRETVFGADVIVTEPIHEALFSKLASGQVVTQPPYVPDDTVFVPDVESGVRHRLAFVGKINYYWQHKRLDNVVAIMQHLADDFDCWFVAQGNGLDRLRESLDRDFVSRAQWHPFVHPDRMPGVLRQIDALFVFETRLPHPVVSNIVLEALATGVGIITDRRDFIDTYRDMFDTGDDHVLVISPDETRAAAQAIQSWVRGRKRHPAPKQLLSFDHYLSMNEDVYTAILG